MCVREEETNRLEDCIVIGAEARSGSSQVSSWREGPFRNEPMPADASCDCRKTWDSLVIRKVIERGVGAREKCSGYMK